MSEESKANFVVSFMDTNTTTVHRNIDYAFEISDSNGTLIFSAAPPGQPVLHTAEGVVTIPYTFQRTGDYSVNVIVYGVDFISTVPQIATFPCNNIPEFSTGFLAVVATAIGAVIFISRYKNPKLS